MSLHDDAVAELSAFAAPADQEAARQVFLTHLAAHPDALRRSCVPDHVTASAVVLDPTRESVLLVLHAKVRRWLQPGGHCEPEDTTLGAAALREATEESGIPGLRLVPGVLDIDRHRAPCQPGVAEHHLDVRYLVLAPPGASPVVSEESLDVAWFRWDELPADLEPSVVRMIAAGREVVAGTAADG